MVSMGRESAPVLGVVALNPVDGSGAVAVGLLEERLPDSRAPTTDGWKYFCKPLSLLHTLDGRAHSLGKYVLALSHSFTDTGP